MINPSKAVILLADDDPDDRLLARDALTECRVGDDIRFVEDGEELMDYLLRRGRFANPADSPRPSLIFLDLNMPRKDGREALQEIRANPQLRQIPIIVFTTSSAETDINCTYDLGANSFISKPARFDCLVNMMKTLGDYWLNLVCLPNAR